jgi:hypothetical protein
LTHELSIGLFELAQKAVSGAGTVALSLDGTLALTWNVNNVNKTLSQNATRAPPRVALSPVDRPTQDDFLWGKIILRKSPGDPPRATHYIGSCADFVDPAFQSPGRAIKGYDQEKRPGEGLAA